MTSTGAPRREVVHGDAVAWLRAHPRRPGASIVTSLPDVSELGVGLDAWRAWFDEAARACLDATPDAGLCVFVQTDIKREGRWISKPALVFAAADALGVPLLFHKVVCRQPPGSRSPGRPGYSHLLGFSRAAVDDPSHPSPDVLPDRGEMAWSHSVGTAPLALAIERVQRLSPSTTTIVAPFCGIGVALALANDAGLDAIGVERNRKRAEAARHATAHSTLSTTS